MWKRGALMLSEVDYGKLSAKLSVIVVKRGGQFHNDNEK